MGHLREEAKELDDWVRFEAEYKGQYAHQLTEVIKNCQSETELKDVIVGSILDKYGIYYTKPSKKGDVNRPTPETKKMIDLLDDKSFNFQTPNSRNSLLNQTIDYLIQNSGLFPALYKVNQLFGDGTDKELIEYLLEIFRSEFIPNNDHIYWVNKYRRLYQIEGKPWVK
ncbi:hypothetical protein ACEN32_07535 [Marinilactibacillus psychrotolerans]|uniref:hypothetical protein n=1 Tax=Marinilactibacillus psychrotolerans TaxID=191770 RepID=UPI003888D95B